MRMLNALFDLVDASPQQLSLNCMQISWCGRQSLHRHCLTRLWEVFIMNTKMFSKPSAQLILSPPAWAFWEIQFPFHQKSKISFCRATPLSGGSTWRSNSDEETHCSYMFFIFTFRGFHMEPPRVLCCVPKCYYTTIRLLVKQYHSFALYKLFCSFCLHHCSCTVVQ